MQADGVAEISDPETGSRMPSMSTGGAAMNAMTKTVVADRSVGTMITPNHPIYRRFWVEVTKLHTRAQTDDGLVVGDQTVRVIVWS